MARNTIQQSLKAGAHVVRRRSGAKVISFYWHTKDKALRAHVKRVPVDREAEALLAEILRAPRPCPGCRKPVERDGKRRYCSDRCAARHRKSRFYRRRAEEAAVDRQDAREAAFVEAATALRARGAKSIDMLDLAREMAKKRKLS